MNQAVIYIPGKGGNAKEADRFKPLFGKAEVIGFEYQAKTPWEAQKEFPIFFDSIDQKYAPVFIVANSIGAYFAMATLAKRTIEKAMFISPIVNMEKLITDMMIWAKVTEEELKAKKEINTAFGETLSWEYLCYVREHPIKWTIPTDILYGEKDNLTSYETLLQFSKETGANITVMQDGEHWFHTAEQMKFLDEWICQVAK